MDGDGEFGGFSKETFDFLRDLELNNSREWFESNRGVFEDRVLRPAQDFVVEMGERLKTISPRVSAIPLIDKSIFRIYRDTRFSTDKTPYKTHIGMLFWEGPRKKLENPNYYVQLNKSSIFIGAGEYRFPADLLGPYRDSVVHPKRGAELKRILDRITVNPSYKIGGLHYKKSRGVMIRVIRTPDCSSITAFTHTMKVPCRTRCILPGSPITASIF